MAKIISKARKVRLDYQSKIGRPVTLQEVAEKTGIARAALTRIELGKTEKIEFETLLKLCAFYGVQVGDLLEYQGDEAQKNRAPQLAQARMPV